MCAVDFQDERRGCGREVLDLQARDGAGAVVAKERRDLRANLAPQGAAVEVVGGRLVERDEIGDFGVRVGGQVGGVEDVDQQVALFDADHDVPGAPGGVLNLARTVITSALGSGAGWNQLHVLHRDARVESDMFATNG